MLSFTRSRPSNNPTPNLQNLADRQKQLSGQLKYLAVIMGIITTFLSTFVVAVGIYNYQNFRSMSDEVGKSTDEVSVAETKVDMAKEVAIFASSMGVNIQALQADWMQLQTFFNSDANAGNNYFSEIDRMATSLIKRLENSKNKIANFEVYIKSNPKRELKESVRNYVAEITPVLNVYLLDAYYWKILAQFIFGNEEELDSLTLKYIELGKVVGREDWRIPHARGVYYSLKDDIKNAAVYFEQAIRMNPPDKKDHFNMAEIHLRKSEYRQAIDECITYLAWNPMHGREYESKDDGSKIAWFVQLIGEYLCVRQGDQNKCKIGRKKQEILKDLKCFMKKSMNYPFYVRFDTKQLEIIKKQFNVKISDDKKVSNYIQCIIDLKNDQKGITCPQQKKDECK